MPDSSTPGRAWSRPVALNGTTTEHRTGCGPLFIIVNHDDEQVREVLCKLGKAGGCASAMLETVGRLISVGLQHGIPIEMLEKQCSGVKCHQHQGDFIQCCVSHIGGRLKQEIAAAAEVGNGISG